MKQITEGAQTVWLDPELLVENPWQSFDPEHWRQQGRIIGSAQGRGTTWFVQLETLQVALRHYRRGGLFGKLVSDHYLFTGIKNSRSYQEFVLLQWLAANDVAVPKPVAARVIRSGVTYTADLISEKIPNARDLVSLLRDRTLPDSVFHLIGREIRKMHNAQVNHTDLNIHNILVDDQQKVWLIDFDKCRKQSGEQWKSQNLSRLERSFRKEMAKHPLHFELDQLEVIQQSYQEIS
ncbi:3-deoxy-D-manno-octulosonic acid kinase [Vibrio sp.]|uniref:3-deoxy-D-manno-octulosonic acid kinase n=1 Tax=Vibrio sp. TaxID=678 RepID=UPI003D121844